MATTPATTMYLEVEETPETVAALRTFLSFIKGEAESSRKRKASMSDV